VSGQGHLGLGPVAQVVGDTLVHRVGLAGAWAAVWYDDGELAGQNTTKRRFQAIQELQL
jgi:hypothetical protein